MAGYGYRLDKEEKGKLAIGQRVHITTSWGEPGGEGKIIEVESFSTDEGAPVDTIILDAEGEIKRVSTYNDIWLLPPADFTKDEITQWNKVYGQRERLKKEKEREEFLEYARSKRSDSLKSYNNRPPKTETEWGYLWITRHESRVVSTGTNTWSKEQAEKMAKFHEDEDSYTEVVSRTVTITTSYSDWS